jgi:predicted nucleic-acid-binding Zn-ribbon protein
MPAKLNTNIFKDRANKIHQDKYDYSLVRYTGSRERVEIICPMHGIFQQRADTHLQGIGCNLCSISNQTYHHNDFVEKAHKVHNYKYEYMGVYTISNNEIEIKCPVHGLFMQKAAAHLRGQGCPKCAIDNRSAKQNLTHEEFLEKVNVIYDNKYQYLTKYINCRSKIEVHCPSHGKFSLLANNHMHGQGCPDCSEKIRIQNIRLSTKEFVDRAKIVHNGKYQYVDDYVSSYFKIKISCPLHGIFQQLPSSHLHGQGCPKCKNMFPSQKHYG